MKGQEIELRPSSEVAAPMPAPTLSIEQVFQTVVERNVSSENIAVMKELLAMDAERKFNAAFVHLQSELPVIVASTVIPNRGKYEKFEDVMKVVSPILSRNGFTVSFSNDFRDGRVIETCHLRHVGGHTASNSFGVRTRRADSETQSDCMAATTAKRNALLNALNIVIRQDCMTEESDAGMVGGCVTPEQAFELERRVAESNSNRAAFLKFAGADKFADIPANRYNDLDAMLRRKEQGR